MKRLVLAVACLAPMFAFAEGALSDAEALDVCAEMLPKQLECKEDFCSAMVDIRKKHQPKFASADKAEMVKGCLAEIAVDGTGDTKARRDRCAEWSKGRPAMKVLKSDATAATACFTKATCGERIGCWAPITEKQMSAAMAGKKK